MNGPPTIRLTDLGLRYGGRRILEGLDLTLASGTWTALLGESGVGKSSLLRALAGLLPPEQLQGCIAAEDGAPLAGRLAYMAQQDLLLPWLPVLGNVLLGARLRGGRAAAGAREAQARALLAEVGLAGCETERPARLSGGMRQRVALARTLMEDRPLVLMDEPFSALDVLTRLRLQDLAARLLAGRTVLLVTHDPLEALRLCHSVHLLAGDPARITHSTSPEGEPPRAAGSRDLVARQGDLLSRLMAVPEAA